MITGELFSAQRICADAAETLAEDPNFTAAVRHADKATLKSLMLRTMRQFEVQEVTFNDLRHSERASGIIPVRDFYFVEAAHAVAENGHELGEVVIRKVLRERREELPMEPEPEYFTRGWLFTVFCIACFFAYSLIK